MMPTTIANAKSLMTPVPQMKNARTESIVAPEVRIVRLSVSEMLMLMIVLNDLPRCLPRFSRMRS